MKILHVIPTLSSGGAEKMLVDLIREMKRYGFQCEVAVLSEIDNFWGDELTKLDIPVFYNNSVKVYSLSQITFLKMILNKEKYDIIHTHLFSAQLFLPLSIKKTINAKIPLVTTEHNTSNRRRDNKLFYLLDKWMYKKYNRIIAISGATKIQLNNYLSDTTLKTEVIENGIDLNLYQNAIKIERTLLDESLTDDEILVVMVAAFREQKDHETAIRASSLLPSNYRLIFVGDGYRMDEVKAYAKKHGRKDILFLGRRSDIPSILKTCDIFLLSSRWEGFGLVVVEAAAAGLAIITSDVEGLSDVTKAVGGKVFSVGNEVDLVKNILEVNMIHSNEVDLGKFAIESTVKGYINIYEEVNLNGNI